MPLYPLEPLHRPPDLHAHGLHDASGCWALVRFHTKDDLGLRTCEVGQVISLHT